MVRVVRATQVEIETAVQALRDGELVAFPTETVYGLGANAQNPAAVRKIFEAKGRPTTHPVIVHLDSPRFLHRWVREVPETATKLAERFWPGPLTMVMARAPNVHDIVTGGQDTVAIRVPSHPMAQQLLTAFGGGIAAPAAPLGSFAQQSSKVWRMGFIAHGHEAFYDALFEGLKQLGYEEGKNLAVERRYAQGRAAAVRNIDALDLVRPFAGVLARQPQQPFAGPVDRDLLRHHIGPCQREVLVQNGAEFFRQGGHLVEAGRSTHIEPAPNLLRPHPALVLRHRDAGQRVAQRRPREADQRRPRRRHIALERGLLDDRK